MIDNSGTRFKHYSTELKLKIIDEIESGQTTAWGARKKYDVGGHSTVYKWLLRFGKGDLVQNRTLKMSKKKDRLQEQKEKNKLLESALADAQLKILALESLVEVADEHYGENLKKNFGSEALKRRKRKKRK